MELLKLFLTLVFIYISFIETIKALKRPIAIVLQLKH